MVSCGKSKTGLEGAARGQQTPSSFHRHLTSFVPRSKTYRRFATAQILHLSYRQRLSTLSSKRSIRSLTETVGRVVRSSTSSFGDEDSRHTTSLPSHSFSPAGPISTCEASLTIALAARTPGICVFAEAVEASADGAREFAKRVQALKQEWLEKAGNPRPQSGARKLIDELPVHPVVDLRTVRTITGVSPEAARQALNRLEAAGVLQNISAGKRNRAFETVGLFALLDAFERDLGPAGRVPIPSQH